LSALYRLAPRFIALAIPTLALVHLAGCSSDDPPAPFSGPSETPAAGGGTASGEGAAPGGAVAPGAVTPGDPTNEGSPGVVALDNPGAGVPTGGTDGAGAAGAPPVTEVPVVPFECVLPELPDNLQDLGYFNEKLPDPFTFLDGTKVTTKVQWDCRRKEILAIADKYLYGPVPPAPDAVTGSVDGGAVTINVTVAGRSDSFTANIGAGSDVIALNLGNGVVPDGSRALSFEAGFAGKIQALYGFNEVNPNVANGWMIDRVLDVLEQNPGSGLDPRKLVVSGCSGCGKGAFLTGVFSRAPVTVIVESGGGGATSFRQVEWFRHGDGNSSWQCADSLPQGIDNLEDNGICGPWVTGVAAPLRANPEEVFALPIDQHLLLATMAPRYVVHFTNNNGVNSWCHLAGTSEALAAYAAKPVWNALGAPERFGFSMYSANHCSASAAQTSLAGQMFNLAFQGDTTANTNVLTIMDNGVQQPVSEWDAAWIDWDRNTVLQ
jgi:(4-O-methyl)-D-glucuronate---lignin esterase